MKPRLSSKNKAGDFEINLNDGVGVKHLSISLVSSKVY